MIRGERVMLRALEMNDVELLHTWMNDPEVIRWLGQRLPISLHETRRWVEETKEPIKEFRIGIAAQEGQLIGWADIARVDPLIDNATLTIAIGDKRCWGRGHGTDAILTLCAYGFGQLNLYRIGLFVFEAHAAAVHLYEKCGFRHEGRMLKSSYRHGQRQNLLIMGILRDEFRAKWPERWPQ